MTPNIAPSTASNKAEFYHDLELQIQSLVDGQRNWVIQTLIPLFLPSIK